MKTLNISWNGLGKDGAIGISKALTVNRTLLTLDITNNRFGAEDVGFIIKGLQQNETLRTIKVSVYLLECPCLSALYCLINVWCSW